MISVIICAHNPRPAYLERTLRSLEMQSLPLTGWALTVVDNASEPRLDRSVDLNWHSSARIVREETLGLTPARLRGIRESTGDVIVFVDDDNVLAPDYLERTAETAEARPFLGAWSGNVDPEFEAAPEEWTRRYWGNLVIRPVTRDAWSNVYGLEQTTPLGAGLCVRREVAREYLRLHDEGFRTTMLDRAGGSLVSGGDNDLAACAIDIGLSCGVIANLRLTHLIPAERLTQDYLLRLIEGVAYSSVILASFRAETNAGEPSRGLAARAADLVRKIRMTSRDRRFQEAAAKGATRAFNELRST